MRDKIIKIANKIHSEHYSDAEVIFLAGSYIRGEATAYSDLDLVVIYKSLPNAYRESFYFEGFPVEAFVHDSKTLRYFFYYKDGASGVPSLPQMVKEGIEIPKPTAFSKSLKEIALTLIKKGPPELAQKEDQRLRYGITDLLDDIRDPRSYDELIATGGILYQALANYYLRANDLWSARGKSIPRILGCIDSRFCERYCESFEMLFKKGDASAVITLAEEILETHGGLLFDGFKEYASKK